MPIFRKDGKIIYFAHVPKAGGTSISAFLRTYADCEAFSDLGNLRKVWGAPLPMQSRTRRWHATSPQHIDAESLGALFPVNFFDYSFAIVRHPEDRILSEYKWRKGRGRMMSLLPFSEWLRLNLAATIENPYVYDGHLRPQIEFIPPGAMIFRLETDMDDCLEWIGQAIGVKPSVGLGHHLNRSQSRDIRLSSSDRALINRFYGEDYTFLGYEPRSSSDLKDFSYSRRSFLNLASLYGAFSQSGPAAYFGYRPRRQV